jgi:hypothetical protein
VPPGATSADYSLSYKHCPHAFQFMTADANRIFTQDLLLGLLDRLRTWAKQNVSAQHASTPFVRVYVDGCMRSVMRDDIKAKWHYLLSLTQTSKDRHARVNVVVDSIHERTNSGITIGAGKLMSAKLEFNDLLVHDVSQPYGIEAGKTSMDPGEGAVFLDGYLW